MSIIKKNKINVRSVKIENLEKYPKNVRIYDEITKETYDISFDELIIRVVTAEIPVIFHTEAIKAQAVASQTYIMNYLKKQNKDQDPNFVFSINNNKTVFAENIEKKRSSWGKNFDIYKSKIIKICKEAQGQFLFFNGNLIPAFFHAASFELTNLPSEVFEKGCDVPDGYPYQKVESKCGRHLEKYKKKYRFSENNFFEILKEKFKIECYGKPKKWIKTVRQNKKNLLINEIVVLSKNINGKTLENIISGNKFRLAFNLPSQSIVISHKDNFFEFETYGYGHGVGMSQIGANYLAEQGHNYKQILNHYFPNTELLSI
ncbi:MAG: SpoIID/LytB domain-containing protein [Oscillospiraceae bacterium]|nr:SpoIID/LytB domain-containing protein [Oscillospiraceae bacterium]